MKKLITIGILLFYTAFSFGVTISTHFCKGKLSSVKVGLVGGEACKCGSKMKKGCCSKSSVTLKIKANQQKAAELKVAASALPIFVFFDERPIFEFPEVIIKDVAFNDIRPPNLSAKDLNIIHQLFRI